MARAPNYGFEKRRKEMERKAKKDAKARRKAEQPDEAESGTAPAQDLEPGPDEGVIGSIPRPSTPREG